MTGLIQRAKTGQILASQFPDYFLIHRVTVLKSLHQHFLKFTDGIFQPFVRFRCILTGVMAWFWGVMGLAPYIDAWMNFAVTPGWIALPIAWRSGAVPNNPSARLQTGGVGNKSCLGGPSRSENGGNIGTC